MHGASEDDVPVPPLLKTALVWGLFMGVSSNLRYQVRVLGARGGHQSGSVATCHTRESRGTRSHKSGQAQAQERTT